MIHRDYRLNRDIHIRFFDNRIEVESPGLLPGNITPATVARAGLFARNLREFLETAMRHLAIFEHLYLLRRIPVWAGNPLARTRKAGRLR
ncbi:MAG: ATP-binding protein [Sulfuritalea sp.]|nr:ATP-binding protein [Sulfuritalea sp.]